MVWLIAFLVICIPQAKIMATPLLYVPPVVRNGSPIKWSTPLSLMATVKDTTCQGGEMERIYKDDGSLTGEQTGD